MTLEKLHVRLWLVGAFLIAMGSLGYYRFQEGLLHFTSEGVFVSGILSLTVDLYLKQRLQMEAARDIFRHLLGFELRTEIRAALTDFLFNTNRYYEKSEINRPQIAKRK